MGETFAEKFAREKKEKEQASQPQTTAAEGAQVESTPHKVVVADGVRGDDSNTATVDGTYAEERLVNSGGVVSSESDFTKDLQALHDEIERLTKEYTAGGLQTSDFPASYHALTNQYRIKAAALNKVVGGVGPEETKVLKEISDMKVRLDAKLAEARARDAANVEDRKTSNQVKPVEIDTKPSLQEEEMKKKGVV